MQIWAKNTANDNQSFKAKRTIDIKNKELVFDPSSKS